MGVCSKNPHQSRSHQEKPRRAHSQYPPWLLFSNFDAFSILMKCFLICILGFNCHCSHCLKCGYYPDKWFQRAASGGYMLCFSDFPLERKRKKTNRGSRPFNNTADPCCSQFPYLSFSIHSQYRHLLDIYNQSFGISASLGVHFRGIHHLVQAWKHMDHDHERWSPTTIWVSCKITLLCQ